MRRANVLAGALALGLAASAISAPPPAAPPPAAPATTAPPSAEYSFEENLREQLEAGEKDLAAGKLEEAEVDFENVLALDAENPTAMERLFDVYAKLGKKLNAEAVFQRAKASGKLEAAKLSAMEKALESVVAKAPAASGTVVASATEKPADKPAPAAGSKGGDDIGNLEKELGKDSPAGPDAVPGLPPETKKPAEKPAEKVPEKVADKPVVKPPEKSVAGPSTGSGRTDSAVKPPAVSPPPVAPPKAVGPMPSDKDTAKLTPEQKFDESIELAKKKDYGKAIPLYVSALQGNNTLLARDDFGLRSLSQTYYEGRAKTDPTNPQIQFMVGWFAELDSRNDDALKAYQQVVKGSKPGDNLHGFATLKVEQIQALQQSLQLAQKQEQEKRKEAAHKKEMENISKGKGTGLAAADYLKKGAEAMDRWKKEKSATALEEANVYYEGALVVDAKNPKTHLAYARMKIDEAIAGDVKAKDAARKELELALTLNPDAETKKQVQSLLDGLGGNKQAAAK